MAAALAEAGVDVSRIGELTLTEAILALDGYRRRIEAAAAGTASKLAQLILGVGEVT